VDGRDALDQIAQWRAAKDPIALMLLDVRMPRLDGIGVLDALAERGASIPTIALTGYADKDVVVELLRRNCADYVEKPVRVRDVVERVAKAFDKMDREQAERQRAAESSLDDIMGDLSAVLSEASQGAAPNEQRTTTGARKDLDFTGALRHLRTALGTARSDVSEATGIPVAALWAMESSPDRSPTLQQTMALAQYYGVPVAYLVLLAEQLDGRDFPKFPAEKLDVLKRLAHAVPQQ